MYDEQWLNANKVFGQQEVVIQALSTAFGTTCHNKHMITYI